MRVFKYLIGLWTGMAVYSVLSLLSGPSGLSAYGQLEAEKERQLVNMRELGTINEKLENTKNSLLYDQDTVAVHARRLGYAGEDEHFVRIVGVGTEQNPYVAAGQVYFAAAPEFMADKTIKIIATCAGMAVFALFFILELLRTDSKG